MFASAQANGFVIMALFLTTKRGLWWPMVAIEAEAGGVIVRSAWLPVLFFW
jgi:hypothetical protein